MLGTADLYLSYISFMFSEHTVFQMITSHVDLEERISYVKGLCHFYAQLVHVKSGFSPDSVLALGDCKDICAELVPLLYLLPLAFRRRGVRYALAGDNCWRLSQARAKP
jgi:hypothetical protein